MNQKNMNKGKVILLKRIMLLLAILVLTLFQVIPAMAGTNDKVTFGSSSHYAETVNGDVVVIGGNTVVEQGANGDVVAILGSVDAKGSIHGDVVAIGGNVNLDGTVNGDLVAIGGKVFLKSGTVVNGQVVASAIEKDDSVVIRGDIVQPNIPFFQVPVREGIDRVLIWLKPVWLLISLLLLTLVVALYPGGVECIAESVGKDTWRDLGIGFIASILLFPLFITIIGIPVVMLLVIAAKYLGYAGVTLFVGSKFLQAVNRGTGSLYPPVILGFLLLEALGFIPFLGGLIGLIIFWLSMGAMLDTKFGTGRPWFNRT